MSGSGDVPPAKNRRLAPALDELIERLRRSQATEPKVPTGPGEEERLRQLEGLRALLDPMSDTAPTSGREAVFRLYGEMVESVRVDARKRARGASGGRNPVPAPEAALRAIAIASVGLLKGHRMRAGEARSFVAEVMTNAGTSTSSDQVENWENDWIERLPGHEGDPDGPMPVKELVSDALASMERGVEAGMDPQEIVRQLLRSTVNRTSPKYS